MAAFTRIELVQGVDGAMQLVCSCAVCGTALQTQKGGAGPEHVSHPLASMFVGLLATLRGVALELHGVTILCAVCGEKATPILRPYADVLATGLQSVTLRVLTGERTAAR